MDLTVTKTTQITNEFIQYLLARIRSMLLNSIIKYEKYDILFKDFDNSITVASVVSQAASNLRVLNYETKLIIQINPTVNYINSSIRLIDLCKLLNYGNLEMNGCHIFTQTFDYIATNFNKLHEEYNLRGY